MLFLDAEGKELARSGYQKGGPAKWIAQADALLPKKKGPGPAESGAEKGWSEDYAAALAEAKKTGKLILADFTGSDWCGWCKKLRGEVFETPEFEAWAAEHVILLELDYPRSKPQSEKIKSQNKQLLQKHRVRGFPTILFLNGEGTSVGKLGYMAGGPGPWIAKAQQIVDNN